MELEKPLAYSYFLTDEIYLLKSEQHLFLAAKPPAPTPEIPKVTFKYLGGNKKNFLVLVFYPANEFILDQHLPALENTIKRLGYQIDDIAILNISKYPQIGFSELLEFFKPQILLINGKDALIALPKSISQNKIENVQNIKTLFTFSFDEMMNSTENKKIFWEQMKQL